jgi:hypothetical protein
MSVTRVPLALQRLWADVKFWEGIPPETPLRFRQSGGGGTGTFRTEGRIIRIRTVDEVNMRGEANRPTDIVAVYGGGRGGVQSPACFFLRVNRVTRRAILQSVQKRSDCFVGEDGDSDMRLVVRAALRWAAQHGVLSVDFVDNSHVMCESGGVAVELANMSFLTTGQTWYESAAPGCFLVSEIQQTRLVADRERVRRATWREVGVGVRTDLSAVMGGIDVDAPGSAMEVLTRAKRGRLCEVFRDEMAELLEGAGVMSYHGKTWRWELAAEAVRRATSRSRRSGFSNARRTRRSGNGNRHQNVTFGPRR